MRRLLLFPLIPLSLVIVGCATPAATPEPSVETAGPLTPADEALEYLNAAYLDEAKAIGMKYGATGDLQFHMTFEDGEFDVLLSTSTISGDDTAYNNDELRAELDAFLNTLTIPVTEKVRVFWILVFPLK